MKKYIISLFALIITFSLSAQTARQAEKLFNDEEYEKAETAYRKLVKSAPSNAGYNYFLGASLYELNKKEEALPYLEKSAKRKYINAYRYLGKLLADMYRYDEAIDNYETHIEWLIEKDRDTEQAENELTIIRQHARMMKGTEQVAVIDSVVVNKNDFLQSYKISKPAGKISGNEEGTVYENEMGNKRIYAQKDENGSMKLYTQAKLLDGWSEAEPVTSLNDLGNVNYPFLMGDGTTLYFASDNEDALGGYDIFITRYDSEDNEYLKPSNVGMPFNSTANDYMMVIDEFNNLGWFATDRNQPEDSVCIYVFIPNESKRTYNYENTDLQTIINAATLNDISKTWIDMEEVQQARQRLANAQHSKETVKKNNDFTFIVNDQLTYHTLSHFRSTEARNAYQQLMNRTKNLQNLKKSLQQKRDQYVKEKEVGKQKLAPSILELETTIPQLQKELDELTIQVRNLEIQQIKK